jgi:Phosphomannomutase
LKKISGNCCEKNCGKFLRNCGEKFCEKNLWEKFLRGKLTRNFGKIVEKISDFFWGDGKIRKKIGGIFGKKIFAKSSGKRRFGRGENFIFWVEKMRENYQKNFKAYDIRGLRGAEINEKFAFLLGLAISARAEKNLEKNF